MSNTKSNPDSDRKNSICIHCRLPVPEKEYAESDELQFCCNGCRTVYNVIHEHGLNAYYDVSRISGIDPDKSQSTGRNYEEYDDPAFADLYCLPLKDGKKRIELYLEGVHCAACVWLVEKVPLAIPGVYQARLDIGKSQAEVIWDPQQTNLSSVARFIDSLGYPVHPFRGVKIRDIRKREDRDLLIRIGIAGAVAGNIMLIAVSLYGGMFSGMTAEFQEFFRWVSLLISLPAVFYSGNVFFRGAWGAIKAKALHMDMPISIGILAAFVSGTYNTIRSSGDIYYDSLTMLIFLLLIGRWIERKRQRKSSDSAELLFSLSPRTARLCETDIDPSIADDWNPSIRQVPLEALSAGNYVEVLSGDTIPADGIIVRGESTLDSSLMTGESVPVNIKPGDLAHAGTINIGATIFVQIENTGENTRIGRLMQVVEEAASRKAPLVRMADSISGWFVGTVLALAAITWFIWWQLDPTVALENMVSLLIVTCPCALGLATPLAVSVAIGRAAQSGILIKGGDVIEALNKPGLLLLDKTGTLTEGRIALAEFRGDAELLKRVASLETHSAHPLATAFVKAYFDKADADESDLYKAEEVVPVLSSGISGRVNGFDMIVGSPDFVRKNSSAISSAMLSELEAILEEARTPILIAQDGEIVAVAGFADPIRQDAKETLHHLVAQGWEARIISGDHPQVVQKVASELNLDASNCQGAMQPEEKLAYVEHEMLEQTVVMVGDGVNDAAALSAASVGISIHGGVEASLAAADIFLTRPGLKPVRDVIDGSRRAVNVIRRNLVFSLLYNLVGATLAITGMINPLVAAVLMPISSLTVVTTSFSSKTFVKTEK
jgi:P-type Cu2+ transporter